MSDILEKTARNKRVQARYDELIREGKHGHYETIFRIVREETEEAAKETERLRAEREEIVAEGRFVIANNVAGWKKENERLQAALQAIIVRCEEGDRRTNWLPIIAQIARAALDAEGPARSRNRDLQNRE